MFVPSSAHAPGSQRILCQMVQICSSVALIRQKFLFEDHRSPYTTHSPRFLALELDLIIASRFGKKLRPERLMVRLLRTGVSPVSVVRVFETTAEITTPMSQSLPYFSWPAIDVADDGGQWFVA